MTDRRKYDHSIKLKTFRVRISVDGEWGRGKEKVSLVIAMPASSTVIDARKAVCAALQRGLDVV